MRHVVKSPYCDPSSFHQRGVWRPRRSPKSPGDVQVPILISFTHRVMSEGQLALVPGTSDDNSSTNSSASSSALSALALLGNWYSTKPRPNHNNAVFTRAGSRNRSGTSSAPITPSVEHRPQGALTLQLV